jgi:hypothetical protein
MTTSGPQTDRERASGAADRDRVPLGIKAFVAAFLAAVLLCGVVVVEAWPLTGWRLFSHLRKPRQLGWQATTVSSTGKEARIRFATFPKAYRHLPLIMRDFALKTEGQQEGICRAWASQVQRHTGRGVRQVRIYRTVVDLRRHQGRRTRVRPRRRLRYTCADGRGVREVAPTTTGGSRARD